MLNNSRIINKRTPETYMDWILFYQIKNQSSNLNYNLNEVEKTLKNQPYISGKSPGKKDALLYIYLNSSYPNKQLFPLLHNWYKII